MPVKSCKGTVEVRVLAGEYCLSRSLIGDVTSGEFGKAPSLALSPINFSELKSLKKDDSWHRRPK